LFIVSKLGLSHKKSKIIAELNFSVIVQHLQYG